MDQGSDDLRQEIEETRAALDDKLDALERKAGQMFDLRYQIAQHPWLALGGAVAAGYVLGHLKDEGRRTGALTRFDSKVARLKTAVTSALIAFLHACVRAYVPALGHQFDVREREQG